MNGVIKVPITWADNVASIESSPVSIPSLPKLFRAGVEIRFTDKSGAAEFMVESVDGTRLNAIPLYEGSGTEEPISIDTADYIEATNIWEGTQAEYDALSNYSPDTLYLILE